MAETHMRYPPRLVQNPPTFHQPPPLPLASSSSDTSFPILAISILGILTTAILLVSYYVFVIKCCLIWRRSEVIGRLSSSRSQRQRRRNGDPFTAYPAAATERRGLEEAVIRAIPIFRFKKAGYSGDQKSRLLQDCAVCLSEFEDGERLRRLPSCSHAFHIDCIDVWLQSNVNCPLCRSDIPGATMQLPADHVLPRGVHQEARHNGGGVVVEVRDGVGNGIGEPAPSREATMQQQEEEEPMAMMPRKAEQKMAQNKWRGKLHHACSMGDEYIEVRRGKDEQFFVQPIRRSFSVDSSSNGLLYLSIQEILQQNPHFYSQEFVTGEGSSSGGDGGKVRRSFFSFGRSSRSSVLPMAFQL